MIKKSIFFVFMTMGNLISYCQNDALGDTIINNENMVFFLYKNISMQNFIISNRNKLEVKTLANQHNKTETDTIFSLVTKERQVDIYKNYLNKMSLLKCRSELNKNSNFPFGSIFEKSIVEEFYEKYQVDFNRYSKIVIESYEGLRFVFEPKMQSIEFYFEDLNFE